MTTPQTPTPIDRHCARLLLFNPRDEILLVKVAVPWRDDLDALWITPGGALEPGETHEQAATRELWEETGLRGFELGPWVWQREHVWRWYDHWNRSIERFFVAHTTEHEVSPQSLDASEVDTLLELRWWALSEILDARDTTFVPRQLGDHLVRLRSDGPAAPIVIGA